jgi:hypothetical protein
MKNPESIETLGSEEEVTANNCNNVLALSIKYNFIGEDMLLQAVTLFPINSE